MLTREDQPSQEGILATRIDYDYPERAFQGGQLGQFLSNWEDLGAPPTLLAMLRGYKLPFRQKPPLSIVADTVSSTYKTQITEEMTRQIDKLKKEKILETASISPSFLSRMFLIPKQDGSFRPVFNLRRLNDFLTISKFRLINVNKVASFIQPGDWMVKVDLSQAYFHLPIHKNHRRFLRLIFNGELLQMTCLPFGLASAPKVFASLTNWIAQKLRDKGLRIIVYLDDFLIVHQNENILKIHTLETISMLQTLGWIIQFSKSTLCPVQKIEYLGIMWNSRDDLKGLPQDKRVKITRLLKQYINLGRWSLEQAQSLLGTLNFASFAIHRGRLNLRMLQCASRKLSAFKPRRLHPIPRAAIEELRWWSRSLQTWSPMHQAAIRHTLTTDASDWGWGAQLDDLRLNGAWSQTQQPLHSNVKEMLAVLAALTPHGPELSDSGLLIQSDNKSVVAYLRNEGGTRSKTLLEATRQVLQMADTYRISLSAHYLPGRFNEVADQLSRKREPPEWHLLPAATKLVFAKWGRPTIDLFASETAHVVDDYVSLNAFDKEANFVNAWSQEWDFPLAWVFPPPCLMPRVLAHLNRAKGLYLIVAPRWKKVFWRPDLKNRATSPPFTILKLTEVLIDTRTLKPPPQVEDFILEVWKCRGGVSH